MTHPDWLDEDDKAESWRPTPGDTLIGTVASLGTWDAGHGEYPIVTIRPDDGSDPLAFHAFHTVARLKLEQLAINPGDNIGIRYTGEVPGKNGNTYHNYVIKRVPGSPVAKHVDKPAPAPAQTYDDEPF